MKYLFIVLFILQASFLFCSDPHVSISRKKVGLDESFSVVFSTNENVNQTPDFDPLSQDFEILSNSQSYQSSIINGKVDQKVSWTLDLMAKREGKLTIPAIQIGNKKTSPEEIEVTAQAPKDVNGPFFLEIALEPQGEVYVQEQIIYTIRLFLSVNFAQASLSELKVNDPDAIIEKLGEDTQYETYHSGKKYVVVERKYAVFPQETGELIFSPIAFEGQAISGGNSFFNRQTQYKRIFSEEAKIQVKGIPASFQKSNWFPANNVTLSSEWSADPKDVKLGEPITWTLKIVAEGALGGHIPDLSLHLPANLKQYPDKPVTENKVTEEGFIGTKQMKIVLIPSKSGEMTIPEINLKWWDLHADQQKEAKLPETILLVKEDAVAMETEPPLPEIQPIVEPQEPIVSTPLPNWVWILVGSNALFLACLIFLLKNKKSPDPLKKVKQELKMACSGNDPKLAESALLTWAKWTHPKEKFMNILKIKPLVSEPFQQELETLYAAIYQNKEWNGEGLWQAFIEQKSGKKKRRLRKKALLQELYPNPTKTN